MNYLGHLYFSNNDFELMYYNLFGDFVKGRDLSRFPDKVQKGLTLHREIDNYIDHHEVVIELLHHLYPELPKISGIAVDLFFDHLLAKNWGDYHTVELNEFLNTFYNTTPQYEDHFTKEFKHVLQRIIQGRWINHYGDFDGLKATCEGLSARIPFENVLYKGPVVYKAYESEIENAFRIYMKEAIQHFNS